VPRLFVAVQPPEDVLDLVAGLTRPDVDGLRWTTREQWHVTLRFLGSVEMDEATDAFRRVSVGATTAELGPETGRFGKRVLQVPVAGLGEVASAVLVATRDVGRPPEDRPFNGHLTLARARDRRRGVDLRALTGAPLAASWPVGEVCLVESHLHPHGANYQVVETVFLGDARTMG
jgi:2'-5' RNA ligase